VVIRTTLVATVFLATLQTACTKRNPGHCVNSGCPQPGSRCNQATGICETTDGGTDALDSLPEEKPPVDTQTPDRGPDPSDRGDSTPPPPDAPPSDTSPSDVRPPDAAPPDMMLPPPPPDMGPPPCTSTCTAGQRRCQSGRVQDCRQNGACSTWGPEMMCPSGACNDSGVCCGTGEQSCGGMCRDVRADNRNCGMCGRSCGSNEQCNDGNCRLIDGQPCTTGSQCVSGTCTMFFRDADGDTYGGTERAGRCTVTDPPAGFATRGGDCCDIGTDASRSLAARIHPGAAWETQSAEGLCGITWDYDCDGRTSVRTEQTKGCRSATPPCETTSGPADPRFCGRGFTDCGGCTETAAIPPQLPMCAYSEAGGQGCVENLGPTPCR
jgi:hypothetical protein